MYSINVPVRNKRISTIFTEDWFEEVYEVGLEFRIRFIPFKECCYSYGLVRVRLWLGVREDLTLIITCTHSGIV